MDNCILLRYAEIWLKSKKTRSFFEKFYVQGIEDALQRNKIKNYNIKRDGGRFIVHGQEVEEIMEVLKRVPGIESFSPAAYFRFQDKESLLSHFKELAQNLVPGKQFAVKVKRVGQHAFKSLELAKEAGTIIYNQSKGVNLTDPEITFYLEVRNTEAYLYTKTIFGIGGLPAKSSGKVLALFSGGIDSPVASFEMLKRGCLVDFLFINLQGDKNKNDVSKVYNYLIDQFAFNYNPKFYLVDGREIVKKIIKSVPDRLRQIALKIVLYQIGEKIADRNDYQALVTGESLSQKSSQTLTSLKLIESQVSLPVLRPLIAMNKTEITKIARRIGTMAASEKIKEYCNLSEGSVVTNPQRKVLEKIPSFAKEIDSALEQLIPCQGLLEVEEDPAVRFNNNLVSVDIRPKNLQQEIPLKTELSLPYPLILEELNQFDKNKSYLIICDFGARSEEAAFLLRKKGIKATGITVKNYLQYFCENNTCNH